MTKHRDDRADARDRFACSIAVTVPKLLLVASKGRRSKTGISRFDLHESAPQGDARAFASFAAD